MTKAAQQAIRIEVACLVVEIAKERWTDAQATALAIVEACQQEQASEAERSDAYVFCDEFSLKVKKTKW